MSLYPRARLCYPAIERDKEAHSAGAYTRYSEGPNIVSSKGVKAMPRQITTPLTERLGCRHPLISAGMGGPARSELAAAVSAAGGFGLLGMVREPPALIEREIAAVRARTDRPFGVNLIPSVTDPALFEAEFAACVAAGVSAFCFFWTVMPAVIERAKKASCLVLYQVGSAAE